MLDAIVRKFKPRTFQGTIVDVQLVDGFTDRHGQHNRYSKQIITEILGHDRDGMPIKNTYTEGMYRVTVVDPLGNTRQFEHYGKPFKIGIQQEFREAA